MDVSLHILYIFVFPLVLCQVNVYHFIDTSMTWADAQQYCREHFTDLVTVQMAEDLNRMNIPAGVTAWIGLHDAPASWYKMMTADANSWRWSATGTTSPGGYQAWGTTQPNYAHAKDMCTTLTNNLWEDFPCHSSFKSVCYKVQSGTKQFTLVNTAMTWAESVDYCRKHYQDLAMVESLAENQEVWTTAQTRVWIGLYREPWRWSDKSNSSFRNWAHSEPNNEKRLEHCVGIRPDLLWQDMNCDLQQPFICNEITPQHSATTIRLQIQSTADLSESTINRQILQALGEELNRNVTFLNLKRTVPPAKKTPQ